MEALLESGFISVEHIYGTTKDTTQIYRAGFDNWNVQRKSWYWQPPVLHEQFNLIELNDLVGL